MSDVEIIAGEARHSSSELRDRIARYLAGTRVQRAIMFGSWARGEQDFASDLDLVLIEPTTLPFVERGRAHMPLFRLGITVDLLIYTPEEYERLTAEQNPLIRRVDAEGVTIYARPGD